MRITPANLRLSALRRFVFEGAGALEVDEAVRARVAEGRERFHALMESGERIYGVTTGFGASVTKPVARAQSETLQKNLVAYLTCGTGPALPREAVRAMMLFRLNSLARGYSGVSVELLERLQTFLKRDWIPVVPREGSLGASGDLIPLAYLARAITGHGEVTLADGSSETVSSLLERENEQPYVLKAKEGLALVNGTSAMCGLAFVNYHHCEQLVALATHATAWACMALQGRTAAFGPLVNSEAKKFKGQGAVAARILKLLQSEHYLPPPASAAALSGATPTAAPIQDRYSLRCAPQVLGPVLETLELAQSWLETEINGVSDNPLISPDGEHAMGGNFYGGYLAHGTDYLKISLGHVADLADRQLASLMCESSNRGLPANLANWHEGNKEEHFLHHGLKGLHQSVSAVTSEILAKATPNSIFSRSAESHNQDKVSLGMSAGVQLLEMIPQVYNVLAMHLACLAQALDLREISLAGEENTALYSLVRKHVPFVQFDQPLDRSISALSLALRETACFSSPGGITHETHP
jgi:histidine ammonia-lyase